MGWLRRRHRPRDAPGITVNGEPLNAAALRYADPGPADLAVTEPRGVRIHHADGTVSECTLIRDPENDAGGGAQWIAVPPPGMLASPGDALSVDLLPARTSILLSVPVDDR